MDTVAESSNTRRAARWSLQGMTALVTGGTRGIGHAVVEELAGLGAAVYTCSRKEAELAECLKKWEGLGFRVSGSVCDLSVSDQREKLMMMVAKTFDGKLNILINNVGTNIWKSALQYTGEDFSFLVATNLESAFHMCQLAHPLLKSSGTGSIIFISSVAGLVAFPTAVVYGPIKGAINQLAKNLACEWAKDNIRVNSVAPWLIRTSLVEQFLLGSSLLSRGAVGAGAVEVRVDDKGLGRRSCWTHTGGAFYQHTIWRRRSSLRSNSWRGNCGVEEPAVGFGCREYVYVAIIYKGKEYRED